MLKKLRRRFILITMALVTFVLFVVCAANVVSTYQATYDQTQRALNEPFFSGGDSPDRPWITGGRRPDTDGTNNIERRGGADGPLGFVPVLHITLDASGATILSSNSDLVNMDETLQSQAIEQALASPSDSGELAGLGLYYHRASTAEGIQLSFAGTSLVFEATMRTLGISLLIFLGALAAFFAISIFLSRIALKPVAEAWEKQRRFIADASHELKTPLTIILANNSLLAAHPERSVSEQGKWIASTQTEAQRMDRLVRQLLLLAQTEDDIESNKNRSKTFGRRESATSRKGSKADGREKTAGSKEGEATTREKVTGHKESEAASREDASSAPVGYDIHDNAETPAETDTTEQGNVFKDASKAQTSLSFDPSPHKQEIKSPALLDLSVLAHKSVLQFEAVAFERNVSLEVEITPGLLLRGHHGQMERLIAILLDNACKYAEEGGVIHVALRGKKDGGATLVVRNTGDPIPPEDLPHVFERFYRSDSSHSSEVEGFGLGLALAKNIIEAHRGTIHITSDAENGTIATVRLPKA
ncbi:MAG: HAMP domain-containing histidine kinase [Coriobacteriaceae bacterium]|jgi:signal transduction histidine kinase|nr:HAMP domain-containing histidine kinase [Coriobacteriaceae bacterium]